jgi:polyisoprenoid-binding protein YceI
MIQKSLLAVSIVFLLGGIAALAADNYKIDPAHSSVMFSVKHMVISNVKGRFPDVSGTILYDEKDVTRSSVTVAIKSASIDTTVADRDKHLRSADFLDVEKYPEIIFKSARIVKKGHGLIAAGNLTLRGR